jgi:SAM-dependent methyltransferase
MPETDDLLRTRRYATIASHYESCFRKHGDSHLGVDWPKADDALKRYDVMLGIVDRPARILDIGCGAAHLLDRIRSRGLSDIAYVGLDISGIFIEFCRGKHPDATFIEGDLLAGDVAVPKVDYAILNGVFTEKRELSYEEMLGFFKALLSKSFTLASVGVAFNVMSKQVDYERDDLFHLPLDVMADFVTRNLSRHFVVRADYGLYEYTVYVWRESPAVDRRSRN